MGRLVWASNCPHPLSTGGTLPDDVNLLDLMLDWAPEQKTRDAILATNPARLYEPRTIVRPAAGTTSAFILAASARARHCAWYPERVGHRSMMMGKSTRDWDADYADGRLDFLDRPHEQLRHAVIACMIAQHAPGEVIDLGCGRGHQLMWLRREDVTRYTGVDVSPSALARLPQSPIPVETVLSSIEEYHAPARDLGAIICAEALYFLDDPVAPLERIAREAKSVKAIIASLVVPNERKPNWRKDVELVWGAFERSGLALIDKIRVESSAAKIAWDVAIYRAPGVL